MTVKHLRSLQRAQMTGEYRGGAGQEGLGLPCLHLGGWEHHILGRELPSGHMPASLVLGGDGGYCALYLYPWHRGLVGSPLAPWVLGDRAPHLGASLALGNGERRCALHLCLQYRGLWWELCYLSTPLMWKGTWGGLQALA